MMIAELAATVSPLSYRGGQWIGPPLPGRSRGIEAWQCTRASGVGHEQIAFTARVNGKLAVLDKKEEQEPRGRRAADLPSWANVPHAENWLIGETYLYVAAGWPLRCFVSQCREKDVRWRFRIRRSLGKNQVARLGLVMHPPRWKNALVVKDQTVGGPFSARVIPLKPIPVGIVVDTLFYAAILWLLTLGLFAARRIIRRKRGHCIKCGYDLRGAEHEVCPECGS